MAIQYTIGCYAESSYYYSVPIRASTEWLQKTLKRKEVINGEPLTKDQFFTLRKRLHWTIEIGWIEDLEYFVEATSKMSSPKRTRTKVKVD